jgi:hypothetical protein
MLFDEPHMEDEMTDEQQEIWSAIRYVDPDKEEDKAGDIAALFTVVALLLIALVVFVLLWVRGILM